MNLAAEGGMLSMLKFPPNIYGIQLNSASSAKNTFAQMSPTEILSLSQLEKPSEKQCSGFS